MKQAGTTPFLKWAGGKRWLLPDLKKRVPSHYGTYYEPFLGGGAIFFGLAPRSAVLADINSSLVELYRVIRDNPAELREMLLAHHSKHCKIYYYNVRASDPPDSLTRAARMLYLNRTCFNGLYRVNKQGKFNVPIGTKKAVVFADESFRSISQLLGNAKIYAQDFEKTLENTREGDFVYVDPPYTVAHNFNGFLKYNDDIFSWEDQIRLRDVLDNVASKGGRVLLSNANHDSIRKLYSGFGKSVELHRTSVIGSLADSRVVTSELLISIGMT